jgi:hypothetical protein
MADDIAARISILALEAFVGQNIEELSEFESRQFEDRMVELLSVYNERTAAVETDHSLLVDIPASLIRKHGRKRDD